MTKRSQFSRGGSFTRNHFLVRLFLLLGIVASFTACGERPVAEVTATSPYHNVVGNEYRTLVEVSAYGIYRDLNNRTLSFITLIPGAGIGGPEIAFRIRLPQGQKIRILSAWRESTLLGSNVYYLVAIQNGEIPPNVNIKIDLGLGNEGIKGELNPSIYERLAK